MHYNNIINNIINIFNDISVDAENLLIFNPRKSVRPMLPKIASHSG